MAPNDARRATTQDVFDAVLAGSWVIDLRADAADAGWLVPWDDDIVLLTDSPEVLETALRDLARIGIETVTTTKAAA
jgi:hypothetical protein